MALISIPNVFTVGAVIIASQHNSNFSVIYSDYNGNIDNSNISASAAISDTKIGPISTAGKVSGAALTSLSSTPSGAGYLPAANGGFPSGGIIMWSGTIATIPSGWFLCNGSNSTPDLRNKFIVCADADSGGAAKSTISGSAAQSGGSTTIDLTQIPAHTHTQTIVVSGGAAVGSEKSGGATGSTNSYNVTASAGGGLPYTQPYYALAYIMKS